MGEWSDYFEDFPEENPANYDDGRYLDPQQRAERDRIRAIGDNRLQARQQNNPNKEISQLIKTALKNTPR
jgi:hypothetical protein